jgi:integrase
VDLGASLVIQGLALAADRRPCRYRHTISRRLGHASPAITLKVYAHLFRKDDSKAAEAIDAALAGSAKA